MSNSNVGLIETILIVGGIICAFAGLITLLLGFLLPAFKKFEIAQKFMKFGWTCTLLMISIFALLAIQLGYYWQGILILIAIAIGGILRKSNINKCPHCNELIGAEKQSTNFTKWIFFRKSSTCQNCKTRLIKAKWPWRMTQVGFILMLVYIFLRFFGVVSDIGLQLVLYGAILLFYLGLIESKFETKARKTKLVVAILPPILFGLLFITWRLFIAIDPNISMNCGAVILLSKEKPEVHHKKVAPLRLVSIDYENRRACIEAYVFKEVRTSCYKYKKGWNKFYLEEGQADCGFYLERVWLDRVRVVAMYPGIKRGRSLRQLWEFLSYY